MEQKRRTIKTYSSRQKRENNKKIMKIIGLILGLILIGVLSFVISLNLFTAGENPEKPENAISSSTEEDIANMSREDLEESYIKLKKQLEEKDEEIEMLKKRLEENEDTSSNAEETPAPTSEPSEEKAESTPKPTAPPAATAAPSEGLMSPEQLESAAGSAE